MAQDGKTLIRLEQSFCVAVGTFNIHIFQPPWLAKIGAMPKGEEVGVNFTLNRPGLRMECAVDGVTWTIHPDRLTVESQDPQKDCGEMVAKVLKALPHTPFFAVGNNFTYRVMKLPPTSTLPTIKIPKGFSVEQRSWHIALRRRKSLFNVSFTAGLEVMQLLVNVHTDLKGKSATVGRNAAARFFEDRTSTESLLRSLLDVEIEDEFNADIG